MKKALEKAIEEATQLMCAQIQAKPFGLAEKQAHELSNFYLLIVKDLAKEFESLDSN